MVFVAAAEFDNRTEPETQDRTKCSISKGERLVHIHNTHTDNEQM